MSGPDFVEIIVKYRAIDTFLGPFLNAADRAMIRATCRAARDMIRANDTSIIEIALKSGYYYLVEQLWPGPRHVNDLLFAQCSGRDFVAQRLLLLSSAILQLDTTYHDFIASFHENAAKNNHFELLKWLPKTAQMNTIHVCEWAAKNNNLEMLKWAHKNGFSYDSYVIRVAAENGSDEIVFWAMDNGCIPDSDLCKIYIEMGRFEMLKKVWAIGAPLSVESCGVAAAAGQFEILKWLRDKDVPWCDTCEMAAAGGHFEILKWARANGAPWNAWTCAKATYRGNFEILKWARANGCPWDEETTLYAARNGHLEILKWAIDEGCQAPAKIISISAINGRFETVKWLYGRGYPLNDICYLAAKFGHLEILKWAWANGGPADCNIIAIAIYDNNKEMLEWAREVGLSWPVIDVFRLGEDHINVVRRAMELGCPGLELFAKKYRLGPK